MKNAYEADTTKVVLRGEQLDERDATRVVIAGNGVGMTDAQFRSEFLKPQLVEGLRGNRRSPVFQRRYSGEKGVGRLAVQKLASVLGVTTTARITARGLPTAQRRRDKEPEPTGQQLLQKIPQERVLLLRAHLDWDQTETAETLDDIESGLELMHGDQTISEDAGTALVLERLRHGPSQ